MCWQVVGSITKFLSNKELFWIHVKMSALVCLFLMVVFLLANAYPFSNFWQINVTLVGFLDNYF